MKTTIPGNRFSEQRIYGDTTLVWLEAELVRVTRAQQANMRSNPRFVAYTMLLKRSIRARKEELV